MTDHIASAQVQIQATVERVWATLTHPDLVRAYLMGSTVSTSWEPGSPITWSGEWEGKPYQDKGEVLEVRPGSRLVLTHFSPLSGQADVPESYHRLTHDLSGGDGSMTLTLAQDNNASEEEAEQNSANWAQILQGLKRVAEQDGP